MQDSKIDATGNLESDDAQQLQLPWSIKRLILWLVLFTLCSFVGTFFVGILEGLDDALEWNLITPQDELLIEHTYLPQIYSLAFLAFLFWQCKKGKLSIRIIWGNHTTQVRYIIFALISGAIVSLLWNWKIVNFDNISAKLPDAIFYSYMIVTALLIPFVEELYFRGMLYRVLRKRNDSVISNLVSAMIFTAYHIQYWLDVTNLPFIFLYGVVTAHLVERTNSLTASFWMHAIANCVHVVVFQYRELFLL